MPRITDAGPVRTTLAQYQARILDAFREALGNDMQSGADTTQGIISRAVAAILSDIDSEVIWSVRGFDPDKMLRSQLDDYAVAFGLEREEAVKSTGIVTITGVAGTVIPSMSAIESANGDRFLTNITATVGSAGTVDVAVTAEEFGLVQAAAGTLTIIIDARPGWTSVTNAAAITQGREEESDQIFRERIRRARDRNALGFLAAIRGRLLDIDDLTYALVLENHTSAEVTTRGVVIAAGGTAIVVHGGTDEDIAEAIYLSIFPGQVLSGSESVDYTPTEAPSGDVTILFTRATEIPAQIELEITGDDTFPGDGLGQIRSNLLSLWEGTFTLGTFVSRPVGLGDLPTSDNLRTVVGQTPGVSITSLELQRVSDSMEITSVDADEILTLDSSGINITYTAA